MVSWLMTLDRLQLVSVLCAFASAIFVVLLRLNGREMRGMLRLRNLLAATVGMLIALVPWFLHDTGHWQCCTSAVLGWSTARWTVRSGPARRSRR